MPKEKKSPVWRYFRVDPSDPTNSFCTVPGCSSKVSRGKKGTAPSKLNTSSLVNHLKTKHSNSNQYKEYLEAKSTIAEEEKEKENRRIEDDSEMES